MDSTKASPELSNGTVSEKVPPPASSITNSNSDNEDTVAAAVSANEDPSTRPKDARFYLIIMSLLVATLLAALDLTAIATALPTITNALQDQSAASFVWIGASYSITSTAFCTVAGGLSHVFGRRVVLLSSLLFFFVGSALCGAALNTSILIFGRAVQGVGSGGILSLTEIILSDLVSLSERGVYQGMFGAIWALASASGPLIGAGFAASNWRFLFYLNLPLTVIVMAICGAFINLKTPAGTFREKLGRIDWIGNAIFIPAITLFIVGLASGGNTAPWVSAEVLAPLIIGAVLLVVWFFVELRVEHPTVPFDLFNNKTTIIGYFTTFMHGISALAVFYYWPSWFQAVVGASPVQSAVDFFSVAFIVAPFAMLSGGLISATQKYYAINIIAWVLMTAGPGILSIVGYGSSKAAQVGLPIPFAMGIGLLFSSSVFVVLAPLPPSLAGHALAFLIFVRNLGSLIGIVIGSVVLTNELGQRLPASYIAAVPGGVAGAYSAIPLISTLSEAVLGEVRSSFAGSIRVIWLVLIPFGGISLIAALMMKEIKLETVTDEQWGLEVKKSKSRSTRAEEGKVAAL